MSAIKDEGKVRVENNYSDFVAGGGASFREMAFGGRDFLQC